MDLIKLLDFTHCWLRSIVREISIGKIKAILILLPTIDCEMKWQVYPCLNSSDYKETASYCELMSVEGDPTHHSYVIGR